MKSAFYRACGLMAFGVLALELLLVMLLLSTRAHAGGVCETGRSQSPVDLTSGSAVPRESLSVVDYRFGHARLINTGETVRVEFESGSSVSVGNKRYELLQMHLHSPAENEIDGVRHPLEAHFVHQATDGSRVVLALLFKVGAANPAYAQLFDHMPAEEGESYEIPGLNPALLLPASAREFAYAGSLTTPPCDEDVSWLVREQILELSSEQLGVFTNLYPDNARAVQPLNGRIVFRE